MASKNIYFCTETNARYSSANTFQPKQGQSRWFKIKVPHQINCDIWYLVSIIQGKLNKRCCYTQQIGVNKKCETNKTSALCNEVFPPQPASREEKEKEDQRSEINTLDMKEACVWQLQTYTWKVDCWNQRVSPYVELWVSHFFQKWLAKDIFHFSVKEKRRGNTSGRC